MLLLEYQTDLSLQTARKALSMGRIVLDKGMQHHSTAGTFLIIYVHLENYEEVFVVQET
jgi:hypothetical protein